MVSWLDEFAVTRATLGLIVGVGYALFGLGALPGGVLSDRIGSRPLIVGCLVGMGSGFFAMSILPEVLVIPGLSVDPGLVGVAIGLVIWGASASVYHPAGLSLISKGVENRGRALGYHGIAGNIGIGAGPFVTAVMVVFVDWRVATAVLAVPALAAAVFAFRLEFDEPVVADGGEGNDGGNDGFVSESRALFASTFAVAFVVVMASGLYYRGILTFLPDILSEVIEFNPGLGLDFEASEYVYSALLAVGIGGQYVGGRLADGDTERWMAIGYGTLAVIALVFVPALSSSGGLVVISLVLGFFLFVVQPLYQNTIARHTPEEARGVSYGYTYLGVFGVGALGATLAGTILTYSTTAVMFVVLAGIGAVGSAAAAYLAFTD